MYVSDTELSIVVPCYNEAGSLAELVDRLGEAFPREAKPTVEFVLVDDASSDGSDRLLEDLAAVEPRLSFVRHPRRQGQTGALWSGLLASRGSWVGHLDGDLQNDPADLPAMYRKAIREDLDAVLGYRQNRHDDLGRRLASRIANGVRRMVLHDSIRDVGCSTRIVRRGILECLKPVANQHRYLPALIELGGWRIAQVAVTHHDRMNGQSKYGNLDRGVQGLRDLPRMAAYVRGIRATAPAGYAE